MEPSTLRRGGWATNSPNLSQTTGQGQGPVCVNRVILYADNFGAGPHFAIVPCVDGSGLAREIFTSLAWSVLPCVRPLCAVHMTAGHNALRGSGPGRQHAFDDAMAQVVVLIAGSTGSALRAVRIVVRGDAIDDVAPRVVTREH